MTDPGSLFTDCGNRTIFYTPAAAGTAFAETKPGGFVKAGQLEGKEPLGTGGHAASAAGATTGIDTGDVARNRLQRISSICFQVNSAGCLPRV